MGKTKKIVRIALCIILAMMISGCNGRSIEINEGKSNSIKASEVISSEKDELHEVVFLNYVLDVVEHDGPIGRNVLNSNYATGYSEETLFAFALEIDYLEYVNAEYAPEGFPIREENESIDDFRVRYWQYTKLKLEKIFHDEGLFLLDNDSFGYIVVGTMSDLKRVFQERENTGGWYIRAKSAVRPDMDEILEQSGWTPDMALRINRMDWFEKNYDSIKELLGTDAKYVVLKVKLK